MTFPNIRPMPNRVLVEVPFVADGSSRHSQIGPIMVVESIPAAPTCGIIRAIGSKCDIKAKVGDECVFLRSMGRYVNNMPLLSLEQDEIFGIIEA